MTIHDHTTTSTTPSLTRLSALLDAVPPPARSRFLRKYQAALRDGTVRAVVLRERFTYRVEHPGRTPSENTLERLDEAVLDTPDFRTWLARATSDVERETARGARRIAVTMDELLSGDFDLHALAEANRQRVQTEATPKKRKGTKRRAKALPKNIEATS